MATLKSILGKLFANDKEVMTEDTVLGVNQTWQNLTASRVANTTYTNDTGRPIQVVLNSGTGATRNFYVNGVLFSTTSIINGGNCIHTATIPDGDTYMIDGTVGIWNELR
jgi:hypothetical protein